MNNHWLGHGRKPYKSVLSWQNTERANIRLKKKGRTDISFQNLLPLKASDQCVCVCVCKALLQLCSVQFSSVQFRRRGNTKAEGWF